MQTELVDEVAHTAQGVLCVHTTPLLIRPHKLQKTGTQPGILTHLKTIRSAAAVLYIGYVLMVISGKLASNFELSEVEGVQLVPDRRAE